MIRAAKKLSRKDWAENIFLLVFVAIALVLLAFTYKLGGKVEDLRKQVTTTREEIAHVSQLNDEFLAAKAAINKFNEQEQDFITLVPTRNEVLFNIQRLEALAAATGNGQTIVIRESPPDLQPKTAEDLKKLENQAKNAPKPLAPNLVSVDYLITLHGNFTGLMSYIQSLEKQPFLTSVKSINIVAEQVGTSDAPVNTGVIDTRIEGTFYYLKD